MVPREERRNWGRLRDVVLAEEAPTTTIDDDDDGDGDGRRGGPSWRKEDSSRRPRRSGSPSSSGGSDGGESEFEPRGRRRQIRPRTYDGTTSFETFWAHFECCSEYNRWRNSDKLAYLKAALVGDAGQVLWDSDPKDVWIV